MKPATLAPLYCSLYPELAEISRKHGYAMAIHGTMARDFDLICIPWVDAPAAPEAVIVGITEAFVVKRVGELSNKPHGRRVQTLAFMGDCFIDLSFMPLYAHRISASAKSDADVEAVARAICTDLSGDVYDFNLYLDTARIAIEALSNLPETQHQTPRGETRHKEAGW